MPGCDGEVRRERAVQDSPGWPIDILSVGDQGTRRKSLTTLVVDFWFKLLDAGSIPAISTKTSVASTGLGGPASYALVLARSPTIAS